MHTASKWNMQNANYAKYATYVICYAIHFREQCFPDILMGRVERHKRETIF